MAKSMLKEMHTEKEFLCLWMETLILVHSSKIRPMATVSVMLISFINGFDFNVIIVCSNDE